jgi:hypothetical protein
VILKDDESTLIANWRKMKDCGMGGEEDLARDARMTAYVRPTVTEVRGVHGTRERGWRGGGGLVLRQRLRGRGQQARAVRGEARDDGPPGGIPHDLGHPGGRVRRVRHGPWSPAEYRRGVAGSQHPR